MEAHGAIVRIQTVNPFSFRFPDRKLLTADALHLVKTLRLKGMDPGRYCQELWIVLG
jgi:hypothetical protein